MWGGNGKNHTWSMGHHWLVALFVLPATLVYADFMSHDSENLQQILYVLGGGASDGNSIWAIVQRQNPLLTSIDSKLSPVSTISSDVVTIKQYLDYNLNGDTATDSMSVHDFIQEFSRKFFKGIDRYDRTVVANPATVSIFSPNGISPFIEPGKTFQKNYTSQIAVTNIAETALLNAFMETNSSLLANIYHTMLYGAGVGYTVYSPYAYTREDNTLYNKAIQQLINGISSWESGDIDDATFLNRYGSWLEHVHDFASHIDYNLLPDADHAVYLNVLTRFAPSLGPGPRRRFRDTYDGISHLYQMQYGTYVLQNMATNTFLSGVDVNNFFTNGVALSLYSTNAFKRVAESSGINTNEMFLGSYGSETNSDVYADIMTNGVELLDGNNVYSSLGEDVDAGFLSNKVSKFNFSEKFDDSIKPFLDEIENASGGDWIINFGTVDLGQHFSFTIPALTVQRNETFLRYVDKFLNVLKIILTFAFFLILWRQLEQSVEST